MIATRSIRQDLRVIGALGRRSLNQTFRRPQYLAPLIIFPTLFLAINTGGAGRAVDLPGFPVVHGFLDFQLAAGIMQALLLAGVSGGIALALDIELGFTDRLLAAPIPRSAIVFGRLIATGVLGVFVGVWFVALGLVFGAHIVGGPLAVLVVLTVSGLSAMAFGGLASALALKAGKASVVQGIFPIAFVIMFLSSAFFPQVLMQDPAATAALWNPISYMANGIREPIISGVSSGSIGDAAFGIGVVAVISFVASSLALRSRLRAA